mgnify:CR=1 FL=1
MANQFANRYVSLVPEQTTATGVRSYGTESAMTAYDLVGTNPDRVYGEVDDESITHQFEVLYRSDMSRFGQAKSQQGKEYSEGSLNFAMQPDDFMGLHFYGVYGNDAVSTGVHTFTESSSNVLPSFTMRVGRDEKEHTYTGMCINRLGLSASLNEYVMVSADYNGKAESSVGTLETPVFSGALVDAMHFSQATVKFNNDSTASTLVKSFNLDWNMNLDTDMACSLGNTTYVRQPTPGLREITGSVEFAKVIHTAVESEPTYTNMITAGGHTMNPTGSGDYAIRLEITDGTSPCTIDLLHVRWEAASANVSGRDSQTMSMNFTALVDSGTSGTNIMSTMTFDDHLNGALRYLVM